MKKIIFTIFIVFLLIPNISFGQFVTRTIDDYSFGLNTKSNATKLLLGESTIAWNIDLTKSPTDLSVRDGFTFLYTIGGADSVLTNGLFSMIAIDGNQKMLIATDSTGVGYGNMYSTENLVTILGAYDSTFAYPNIVGMALKHTIIDSSNYNFWVNIRVLSASPVVLFYDSIYVDLDTITSSQIVSFFVDTINSDVELSSYITASTSVSGDSLIIIEDDSSVVMTIAAIGIDDYIAFPPPDSTVHRDIWEVTKIPYIQPAFGVVVQDFYPISGRQWWCQFRGGLYFGTGVSRAYVYDGKNTNSFPLESSGELKAIPLADSGGANGVYRYSIEYLASKRDLANDTVWGSYENIIGTRVVANQQNILLTNFQPLPTATPYDTMEFAQIKIWRGLGDMGALDALDSLFLIDSFEVDTSALATFTYTDVMSDVTLRTKEGRLAIVDISSVNNNMTDTVGSGVVIAIPFYKYYSTGSPIVIDVDSAKGTDGIWGDLDGTGVLSWEAVAGWSYFVVAIDTSINIPSDSSRSFNFYQEFEADDYDENCADCLETVPQYVGFRRDLVEKVSIKMPTSTNENIIFQLFRGAIEPVKYDSLFIAGYYYVQGGDAPSGRPYYVKSLHGTEFAVIDYFLVGEFAPSETCLDSLGYGDLVGNLPYTRNAIPPIITDMVAFDNQLVATDGDLIYYSDVYQNSINFGVLSAFPVDAGGGSRITKLKKYRNSLRAFKNNKSYNLYRNSAGGFTDVELSGYYGNVSPFGVVTAPEGIYFISSDGVRLEQEGIYRDRIYSDSRISDNIRKFEDLGFDDLKQAYSVYYDNKLIISLPDDTTMVYNKVPVRGKYKYGWTQWSFGINASCFFGAGRSTEVSQVDTMIFSPPSSAGIYRFGGTTSDTGIYIPYQWQSGSLFPANQTMYSPVNMFFQIETTDSANPTDFTPLQQFRSNEIKFIDRSLEEAYFIMMLRADTTEFHNLELPLSYSSNAWYFNFRSNGLIQDSALTIIKKAEITFEEAGRYQR